MEELLTDQSIFVESHREHGRFEIRLDKPTKVKTKMRLDKTITDSFLPGLATFHDYLTNLRVPSDFSGTRLRDIMATFETPFAEHMRSEVATIAALSSHPRTPKEGSEEEKAVRNDFDNREAKNLIGSGITDVLPFFLFNFDRQYEE